MQIGNSVKDSLSNVVLYSVRDGLRITVWGSVENLVFKEMRNNGAYGDLIKLKSNAYSKIYSE